MKKNLFIILLLAGFSIASAQTKGTNTLGLGVNIQTQKGSVNSSSGDQGNEQTNRFFNLGYGHFVKDNVRLGIDLSYGKADYTFSNTQNSAQNFYGGRISYQKYYPLLKKFYAFGGGRAGYEYSKGDYFNNTPAIGQGIATNSYSVGGYGGLTWFLSKRFAFETDLLSANISYTKTKDYSNQADGTSYQNTNTTFNLATTGAINNLGFKIYFLF